MTGASPKKRDWMTRLKDRPVLLSTLVATVIILVSFFLLLGLPGAAIYDGMCHLLSRAPAPWSLPPLKGDQAWPAALVNSLLWPLGIIAGAFFGWVLLPKLGVKGGRWPVLSLVVLVGMVLSSFFVGRVIRFQ